MEQIFEKNIFNQIFEMAKPFNDLRGDEGHALIVANYAIDILKKENLINMRADPDLVIPAAILHDIGWSQMSIEDRMYIFTQKITKEVELSDNNFFKTTTTNHFGSYIRRQHEIYGANLAYKLLTKLGYNTEKIMPIFQLISQHDTNKELIENKKLQIEDMVVKDADKLWTYSKQGIDADVRRFGFNPQECIEMAEKRIDRSDYFFTKIAREIARYELSQRKIYSVNFN